MSWWFLVRWRVDIDVIIVAAFSLYRGSCITYMHAGTYTELIENGGEFTELMSTYASVSTAEQDLQDTQKDEADKAARDEAAAAGT